MFSSTSCRHRSRGRDLATLIRWTCITVFARDDATIVPSGALFRRGEGWNVCVAKDGRAGLRQIKLLRRSGRLAAITSGLAPGEEVIVYPSDKSRRVCASRNDRVETAIVRSRLYG